MGNLHAPAQNKIEIEIEIDIVEVEGRKSE